MTDGRKQSAEFALGEAAMRAAAGMLAAGLPDAIVMTGDAPPLPGATANGAGIRAWGIARGLRELGLDARLVFPAEHVAPDQSPPPDWALPLGRDGFISLVSLISPNGQEAANAATVRQLPVLIFQHWPEMSDFYRGSPGLSELYRMALDLAGPHLLERKYWGGFDQNRSMDDKCCSLNCAEFLLFGGARQGAYFQAIRAALALPDVPAHRSDFALPVMEWASRDRGGEPSAASEAADAALVERLLGEVDRPLVLFSGLALPWQNPIWAMRRTFDWMDRRGAGELLIVGPERAGDNLLPPEEFQAFAREIDDHPRAHRLGRMSFDAVLSLCRAADFALDLYEPNAERGLAVPSRTAVYAATGLPVLINAESEWGAALGREELPISGAAVPWADDEALEAALDRLTSGDFHRPPLAETADFLGPERNLGPLRDWIRSGARGRDPRGCTLLQFGPVDIQRIGAEAAARAHLDPAGTEAVARALEACWPEGGTGPGDAADADERQSERGKPIGLGLRRGLAPLLATLAARWAGRKAIALSERIRGERDVEEY